MYASSEINIGNTSLGGNSPVRIQSMTTTKTMDTVATVNQVANLAKAGCDFVRITTQNINEANNLKVIKEELCKIGIYIPLIADVHFIPKIAEAAAQFVEKVRINPGNYIDSKSSISEKLIPLLSVCKKHNTAIRIGVNHGSLSETILYKYGNTALGMVESLMEFVRICKKHNFNKLVLSVKASNVVMMIDANKLLVEKLLIEGLNYPIHLGVTEAGSEDEGRVKSASGIGYLLAHGIGDTIRVSLSEDPVAEIPVAKMLVDFYGKRLDIAKRIPHELIRVAIKFFSGKPPLVLTSGMSGLADYSNHNESINLDIGKKKYGISKLVYHNLSIEELIIRATVDATILLLNNETDGIWIENNSSTTDDQNAKLSLEILQVLGLRISKTEFIACPTCGRSSVVLVDLLQEVKKQTSHIRGLKIAVMGCSVNGPGEMADADYGMVGTGNGNVDLYKGRKLIHKNIKQEQSIDALINLIKISGDWKNK